MKYFYENAKAGDHIATYRPQWYMLLSQFISLVQKDRKSHILAITKVLNLEDIEAKTYFIAEQNYPYPNEFTISITKEGNQYKMTDGELKGKYGYLLELKEPLTEKQKKDFYARWKQKVVNKKRYSFLIYPFTLNWFYALSKKFFGEKVDRLLDKKSVCSTEALYNLSKVCGYPITDNYPTPSEFSKLDIFKQPNERCF